MTTVSIRSRRRADWHRERAVGYRDDAILLMQQYGHSYSAGALLYESAKQCVNALANQAGKNPGSTGAKKAYLYDLALQLLGDQHDLENGWLAASHLHIHADRGNLNDVEFRDDWAKAQRFIADLLAIYAAGP